MDNEKARKIIMDNYQNPKNRNMPHENYQKVNTRNESCIDNIDLYIKWDKDMIKDITFEGEACAVSISSTSIMIKNLIGKTKDEALVYIDNFEKMLNDEDFDEIILQEAIIYKDISKQGNRKICANLPLNGIKKAILEKF